MPVPLFSICRVEQHLNLITQTLSDIEREGNKVINGSKMIKQIEKSVQNIEKEIMNASQTVDHVFDEVMDGVGEVIDCTVSELERTRKCAVKKVCALKRNLSGSSCSSSSSSRLQRSKTMGPRVNLTKTAKPMTAEDVASEYVKNLTAKVVKDIEIREKWEDLTAKKMSSDWVAGLTFDACKKIEASEKWGKISEKVVRDEDNAMQWQGLVAKTMNSSAAQAEFLPIEEIEVNETEKKFIRFVNRAYHVMDVAEEAEDAVLSDDEDLEFAEISSEDSYVVKSP